MTTKGRAIRTVSVPPAGQPPLAVFFDRGIAHTGIRVGAVELKIDVSSRQVGNPDKEIADMDFKEFSLSKWRWNARGVGALRKWITDPPPPTVPNGSVVPGSRETHAHYQQVLDVETATNQCFPMSIANSIPLLEHQGKIKVPHNLAIGLKRDHTLVGKLDTACDRSGVTKGTDG